MYSRLALAVVVLAVSACTAQAVGDTSTTLATTTPASTTTSTTTTSTTTTSTTTTTTIPRFDLTGAVTSEDGLPVTNATVTVDGVTTLTDVEGAFAFTGVAAGPVAVNRASYLGTAVMWDGAPELPVTLERDPFTARAIRVSRYVAKDPAMYQDLLELVGETGINALVFDTKDETGSVLYDTSVEEAHRLGAVEVVYDPMAYLAAAEEAGLYTITRVVSFEDRVRVKADPDSKLIGQWVDITNEVNWDYLLDLGVEACELGFDEVQFDYIRFPAGITGAALRNRGTFTAEDRIAAVTGFLREAGNRIHPLGCAISADVFGIVLSSPTDEGIGQRPEEVSYVVDYISPMLYPSHYSEGTLGYEDPNSAPGPIISWALDSGLPRLEGGAIMRPWLQAFYYNGSQIGAEIAESEERGVGWMLWNAGGEYPRSWLPDPE